MYGIYTYIEMVSEVNVSKLQSTGRVWVGCWGLGEGGTRGIHGRQVVEAGLLEGSLRLRFQGFGFTLFSVEMQNLSKEAPRGPDGRFWRAGCAGCYTRTDENWIRPVVRKPDTVGFFYL